MPITKGHMQHVKNRLVHIVNKRYEGLHVKQTQCQEETTDDVSQLLAYVEQKLKEA